MTNHEAQGRPVWDDETADSLIGALVLIGITRVLPQGAVQEQVYGHVISAHPRAGFVIELQGLKKGETFRLPPDLRAFQPAPPGDYRLRGTGETVTNPDYLLTWTINAPKN